MILEIKMFKLGVTFIQKYLPNDADAMNRLVSDEFVSFGDPRLSTWFGVGMISLVEGKRAAVFPKLLLAIGSFPILTSKYRASNISMTIRRINEGIDLDNTIISLMVCGVLLETSVVSLLMWLLDWSRSTVLFLRKFRVFIQKVSVIWEHVDNNKFDVML